MQKNAKGFASQLFRARRAWHRRSRHYDDGFFIKEKCSVCGSVNDQKVRGVLWEELVRQWKLTPDWANWIDQREGLHCLDCEANLRSQHLATCIIREFNGKLDTRATTLADLCSSEEIQPLKVAEINYAGQLHPFLSRIDNLSHSEYGSKNPDIPSEDIQNLSYSDSTFDLVVHSDVLEHVPDTKLALSEIHRVLKPKGLHIFTVPIPWNQESTRCRAKIIDGDLVHLLSPSYHGSQETVENDFLVFHEFGSDFISICEEVGFKVTTETQAKNPSVVTFITEKAEFAAC